MPLKIKLPQVKWPVFLALVVLVTAPIVYYKACRNYDSQPLLHSALLEQNRKEDKFTDYEVSKISEDAFTTVPDTLTRTLPIGKAPREPQDKLHPAVKESLATLPPTKTMRVMISFRDEVKIIPLPELDTEKPSDSKTNQKIMTQARALLKQIEDRSKTQQDSLILQLEQAYGAKILERFVLINCVLAEMPVGNIERLSENRDVVYIAPQYSEEAPPLQVTNGDTNDKNDVDDARHLILGNTNDFIVATNQATETIGLLDTGVRFTHRLISDRILRKRNCADLPQGAPCQEESTIGDVWTTDFEHGHGTSSAAILSGNASMGPAYQGMTQFKIDSYRVYSRNGLDRAAVVKAFDEASLFNRVILAEIQAHGNGDEFDAISRAANKAFDIGAVVIAANGNNDDGYYKTKAPAIARKVIGVGAVDVVEWKQTLGSQCYGTYDGRYIKPDIQAPSYTETASGYSDNSLRIFTGTSGAAPYAAAAAAIIRNRLKGLMKPKFPEPGLVYTFLILAGTETPPLQFDRKKGAGLINVQNYGRFSWGNSGGPQSFSVKQGDKIDIRLKISGASPHTLSAALWWPEEASDWHANIYLYIIGPDGKEEAHSEDNGSVFQRIQVKTSLKSGDEYRIQIRGNYVPRGSSRQVYCAIHYYDR